MIDCYDDLIKNPRPRDARRPRSEAIASSLVAIVRAGALHSAVAWHGQDCTAHTAEAQLRRKRARVAAK